MASSMLGVDLTIDDFPTLLNYLDQLIQKAPAAQKAMRRAFRGVTATVTTVPGQSANANTPTSNIRVVVVLQGNTGTGGTGTGQGRQKLTPAQRQARNQANRLPGVYGAAQRHRDLQRDLHDPAVVADRARFQDTLRAFQSNERRMNGASLGDKLTTMVRSTRINAGPLSPLVGRTLDVIAELGPEGEAVAAITTAALAAAGALFELGKASASVGNRFSSLQVATGSGIATTSDLTRLGAGLGMSPEQTAAAAQTLQDRITSDPAARATGLHLGVYNLPGPYGNQDYGGQLEIVLRNLQKISNPQERLREARNLGIPDAATLPASAKVQGGLDLTAATRTAVVSQEFLQDSRDFGVAMDNVGSAFSNFLAAIGPTVLPEITDFLLELAQAINSLAKAIQDNRPLFDALYGIATQPIKTTGAVLGGPLAGLSDTLLGTHFLGGNDSVDAQTAATERNTAATERNTAATMNSRYAVPGVYGTFGDRGTGLPSGVNGQSISRATLDLSLF